MKKEIEQERKNERKKERKKERRKARKIERKRERIKKIWEVETEIEKPSYLINFGQPKKQLIFKESCLYDVGDLKIPFVKWNFWRFFGRKNIERLSMSVKPVKGVMGINQACCKCLKHESVFLWWLLLLWVHFDHCNRRRLGRNINATFNDLYVCVCLNLFTVYIIQQAWAKSGPRATCSPPSTSMWPANIF